MLITSILTSCHTTTKEVESSKDFFAFDTSVFVKCYGDNAENAIAEIEKRFETTEKLISAFIEGSYIDKININAGLTAVKVDDFTFDLIEKSLEFSEKNSETFDITVGALSMLWKEFFDSSNPPNSQQISAALKTIDHTNVVLNEDSKTVYLKNPDTKLDLGGVAKGYICNTIDDIFINNEIKSAMISIGGNVYTYKTKPDNTSYTIGIRDPKGMPTDIMAKLQTHDTVVATSGAYERFFVKDGVTYHHIIDLKTGYPSQSDIQSVTVVSEDGALTDMLSTAIFIEGTKNINYHLTQSNYSVIIIDNQNNVYVSDKLKKGLTITNNDYILK